MAFNFMTGTMSLEDRRDIDGGDALMDEPLIVAGGSDACKAEDSQWLNELESV